VLKQVEHLRTYPRVKKAAAAGRLRLHAWWFDIAQAEVLEHDPAAGGWVALDDARLAARLASLAKR
jgi:carbonic anhydrase